MCGLHFGEGVFGCCLCDGLIVGLVCAYDWVLRLLHVLLGF